MKLHPSIELVQHGPKGLVGSLDFAKAAGAQGAQPSNYLLEDSSGKLMSAADIRATFDRLGLSLDGISAHGPFYAHGTAWTGSPTIRRFIPADVALLPPEEIERWTEDYLLELIELAAELKVPISMFWGMLFGWEVGTGFPWPPWDGPACGSLPPYDLLEEGKERFVGKTRKLRDRARSSGVKLCDEIHPNSGSLCAADFNMLVEICDGDECLGVCADLSHCAEGEPWLVRFPAVGARVYTNHIKNHAVTDGMPLRSMIAEWPKRGMRFTDLREGDLCLPRFVEMLLEIGQPQRYCEVTGSKSAALVAEAESSHRDLDSTSARGIAYVRDELCFPIAVVSHEAGIGKGNAES